MRGDMVRGSRAHTERHSARSACDYGVRSRGTGLLACLAWFPGPPAVCRPPPVVARVQTRCLRPGSTLRQPLTLLRVTFAQMGSTLGGTTWLHNFPVGAERSHGPGMASPRWCILRARPIISSTQWRRRMGPFRSPALVLPEHGRAGVSSQHYQELPCRRLRRLRVCGMSPCSLATRCGSGPPAYIGVPG